jgi:hypothetical protein
MQAEEKRLGKEIRSLTERARQTDEREDKKYGADRRGDELPEELRQRQQRLETIRAARRRLEQRQREMDEAAGRGPDDDDKPKRPGPKYKRPFGRPPDKAQENFTDPDSRIMKSSKGFEQCYNTQLAVDEAHGVVVAADVAQQAADNRFLEPMIDAVERNTGRIPRRVLADAGYRSEATFRSLEQRKIDGYIAIGRGEKAPELSAEAPATARMARKLGTQRGRRDYRKRKHIAEPPFGWIKAVLGFRQFSLRGLNKVQAEWQLVCLAVNLRRMSRMIAWT